MPSLYHYGILSFYDCYLNRWLGPDTIVPQPGNPQSLNRYSYVLNNPLKFVDPTGHAFECSEIAGGACGEEGHVDWGGKTTDESWADYYERTGQNNLSDTDIVVAATAPIWVPAAVVVSIATVEGIGIGYETLNWKALEWILRHKTLAAILGLGAGEATVTGPKLVVGGGRAIGFPAGQAGDVSLNISRSALPNVMGDIAAPPFTSGSFGEVFFERVPYDAFTGQNIVALDETARILQPGGSLVIETGIRAPLGEILATLQTLGFTNIQTSNLSFLRLTAVLGGH